LSVCFGSVRYFISCGAEVNSALAPRDSARFAFAHLIDLPVFFIWAAAALPPPPFDLTS
jgi:hypothetical protein